MTSTLGFSSIQDTGITQNNNRRSKYQKTIKRRRQRPSKVKKFLNSMMRISKNKTINKRNNNNYDSDDSDSEGYEDYKPEPDNLQNTYDSMQDTYINTQNTTHNDSINASANISMQREREREQEQEREQNNNTGIMNNYNPQILEQFGLLKDGLKQQQKYLREQQKHFNSQYIPNSDNTSASHNVPYYSKLANSQEVSGNSDELMNKLNYVVHMLEEQQDERTGNVTEELILYMFLGVFVIFVVDSFARVSKYTR